MKKRKIGLLAGGIEVYWTDLGMKELPERLDKDVKRLIDALSDEFEVIYPGLVGSKEEAALAGKAVRDADVDLALMYHSSYLDDAMSLAFLDEIGNTFSILFHSQGFGSFTEDLDLVDFGRGWGNNSSIQLPGTLRRLRPNLQYGYVFGGLTDPESLHEIKEYAYAASAVKNLKGKRFGYLPHRCTGVPMYDTFPDEPRLMSHTGIEIEYLYIIDLVSEMKKVTNTEAEKLTTQLYADYDVVEPSREEVVAAARQAIALERMVEQNNLDAISVDFSGRLIPLTGAMPCVGMARLIDQGIVVSTEGDIQAAVAGLMVKEVTGLIGHFWENLAFDTDKNWVLGGHEGGSAGFSMAKKGTKARLRGTQYVDMKDIPGAPPLGVVPEFITDPGPVTLVTLYRDKLDYEMRIACGESVDLPNQSVQYEHAVFKPNVPLKTYFENIAHYGVDHHFAMARGNVAGVFEKIAQIIGIKNQCLTR